MDLQPSETEEAVRAASETFLRDHFPLAEARARPRGAWAAMAGMGWFGIALPEEAGGIGLGFGAEALVFAELGRFLAPIGAIAGAVAARIAQDAGDAALATAIAEGGLRVALGLAGSDGTVRALDAEEADLLVLTDGAGGAIHAMPGDITTVPCLDLSVRQAIVPAPAASPRARVTGPLPAQHQQIAAAAFALGCAEAARDMAVDYAKIREQFGKPIGSFQALKHICADMAVRCSTARAQLLYAALALEAGRNEAAFHVAAAKRLAQQAALDNGRANIQVHGGIGMTDEADAHLTLKRAHLLEFITPARADMLLAS
ncbi:MAG: acyl-CoA dehydrogenase family protein [Sphingobium sp.]